MDFGMPTLIENEDLEENIALCRELGLQFIELNMNLPLFQTEQLEETDKLRRLAAENGIYFTIHLDENLNVCDFNTLVADAYTKTVERVLMAAKEIGAPLLNMHMDHGVYFTLPDRKVYLFDQYQKEYMEGFARFREMCERVAGDSGIKVCIENTDGFRDFEKKAIDYLLQSGMFGLTWDIGHSHSCGNIDESFLMERKDRLHHFHIHDGAGKKNHQTLGTGEIDLAQRLGLAETFGCRCVVETKTVEALRQSVVWLRENGFYSSNKSSL